MSRYECSFHVGDLVTPEKSENLEEGPGWSGSMIDTVGKIYEVRDIKWHNGYYIVNIGDNHNERQWNWMDKWLQVVDYTLF